MTLLVAAVAIPLAAPAQDMVQLNDGRVVEGQSMTLKPDGVVIHYKNGDVHIPKDMVKVASCSKNEGGEAGQLSAKDKAKLAKGLVRFEGKWVKKAVRARLMKRRAKERSAKIKEAKARQKWRNRYIDKTRYFQFEYTIDPDKMSEYKTLMETYYKVFTKEWRIKRPKGFGPLKVCFYHDPEYYHQVSGAQQGVIGYFRFRPKFKEELNYYYERLDERMTIDVMFHETNHYLTYLIDPDFHYPPWVNESLAEYYGASEWDGKRKKMSTGRLQEGRLSVIQDRIAGDNWQGLKDLIELSHGSFNAVHYAWGWSFVHFLMQNKKYAKGFKRFYMALAREKSIKKVDWSSGMRTVDSDEQIKALKKYLKVKSLDALEKEWHTYIKGLKQTSHRGYARAAQLFLSRGMPIKARRFFKTAIEKGNDSPLTFYGLGKALRNKSKNEEAVVAFKDAIKRDPLNGMFYVYLARTKASIAGSRKDEEALRLKKLALEIEPDNHSVIREAAFDDLITDISKSR